MNRIDLMNVSSIIIIMWTGSFAGIAQITPYALQKFISSPAYASSKLDCPDQVTEFYTRIKFVSVWMQTPNEVNRSILLSHFQHAADIGLNEKDYQFKPVEAIRSKNISLLSIEDSLAAEVRITDAAIHFLNDLSYGNTIPAFRYHGLKYSPNCNNIPMLLEEYVSNNTLPHLIVGNFPVMEEIKPIERKIKWFQKIIAAPNFAEVNILFKTVNQSNKALITKLYQLGIIDSINKNISDTLLVQKVKEAQRHFDLLDDGVLRTTCLKQLNIPLSVRIRQLNLSINYYRWLYCITQNTSIIVVNLPAAYLKVYRDGKTILEMKVIVGKNHTPTPTLASTISEVVLYPYWHVPLSIATKELLPYIKRSPSFLEAGNYQVLNKSGKIIDPYTVNWNLYSKTYFPFIIRQSTGCDNSLGLLKLNFFSPFGVYLHDTPDKMLFMMGKRFFSHGCVRLEEPMQLGHLILKNNPIAIDTLEQKGCLRNQSPITVEADERMPVIVWYNPAGIDKAGRVIFYDDIYGKFNWKNE
ncbi:MAG: L,D-transpeptidase family protein [Chitinophagaceae bacterium]